MVKVNYTMSWRIWLVIIDIHLCSSKTHVIPLTQNLKDQGYEEDLNLGEIIAEQLVESPVACGLLCEGNPACKSVMMVGQSCRMFGQTACRVGTSNSRMYSNILCEQCDRLVLFSQGMISQGKTHVLVAFHSKSIVPRIIHTSH